jgi:hypothetical protein
MVSLCRHVHVGVQPTRASLMQLRGAVVLALVRQPCCRDYLPHAISLYPALIVLSTIDDRADKHSSGVHSRLARYSHEAMHMPYTTSNTWSSHSEPDLYR